MNHPYIARLSNSIFVKMSNDTWQAIGNIASTTGITAVAYSGVKGVVASYQTYASPSTSLKESERKLKRVRSQLNGLTSQRREEIETATRSSSSQDSSDCMTLGGLEIQLQACVLLIDSIFHSNSYPPWDSLVSWTHTVG